MFCFVKKSLDYSYIVGGYNDMFEIVSVISMFSYKRVQMSSLVNVLVLYLKVRWLCWYSQHFYVVLGIIDLILFICKQRIVSIMILNH